MALCHILVFTFISSFYVLEMDSNFLCKYSSLLLIIIYYFIVGILIVHFQMVDTLEVSKYLLPQNNFVMGIIRPVVLYMGRLISRTGN